MRLDLSSSVSDISCRPCRHDFVKRSVSHSPPNRSAALGKLLTKCGFEYWDLGMEMDYKRRLGAELMGRSDFVTEVKRSRIVNKGVMLHCGGDKRSAKEFIDWEQPRSISHDSTYLQNGSSILRTVSDEE